MKLIQNGEISARPLKACTIHRKHGDSDNDGQTPYEAHSHHGRDTTSPRRTRTRKVRHNSRNKARNKIPATQTTSKSESRASFGQGVTDASKSESRASFGRGVTDASKSESLHTDKRGGVGSPGNPREATVRTNHDGGNGGELEYEHAHTEERIEDRDMQTDAPLHHASLDDDATLDHASLDYDATPDDDVEEYDADDDVFERLQTCERRVAALEEKFEHVRICGLCVVCVCVCVCVFMFYTFLNVYKHVNVVLRRWKRNSNM
jgi:hypothetical protein